MNLKSLFLYFTHLRTDNISFIYQGIFSDEITEKILRLTESDINKRAQLNKVKNKVAFLLAECFQNIVRHEDKPEIINNTNNKPGMFMLRNNGSSYYIASANRIVNSKVDHLKTKLEYIAGLSLQELKEKFLDQLANEEISEKGGAGLGLMVIAQKSGKKIEYDFELLNYFLSLFYLQTRVDMPDVENPVTSYSLSDTKKLYRQMSDDRVVLISKGDFSQESILPLIGMIERNMELEFQNISMHKRLCYVLIEMLQNISKHGVVQEGAREGILVVGKKEKNFFVNAGNLIEKESIPEMKEMLEELASLQNQELKDLYINRLKNGKVGVKGGAGLGLIDIARYSKEKIQFDFFPLDEKFSFFSIGVTI